MGGANGEAEAPTGKEVRSKSAGGLPAPASAGAAAPAAEGPTSARAAAPATMGATASAGGGAASSGQHPEGSVRLVLWRHGQTQWNVDGRFQGQSDIPLDPEGERQAERAARLLAALQPAAIFSSDLTRAMSTAAPLARLTGLTVISDKDLRERYGGEWEGLTDTEIRERYPDAHTYWQPPGGETSAAVADRAAAAMDRIAEGLAPEALAVVVSHGAALRLGAARLLGLPEELWGAVGPLANCAWSVLGRRRGRWRLLEHNAGTLPEPVLSDDR